ncbi:MAG: type II secretion system F family protein [Thermodesulfobacteriota bacterium]
MEDGILIMLFAAVCLGIAGIYAAAEGFGGKRKLKKRLEELDGDRGRTIGEGTGREKMGFHRFLGTLGRRLLPRGERNTSELRRLFLQAGYRNMNAIPLFLGLKVLLALALSSASVAGKLLIWSEVSPVGFTYVSVVLAIFGFYTPNMMMKMRISSRREKIRRGLPDALDLMVVCMEAGTGLDAALSRTAGEMRRSNPCLAHELELVILETRAGKPRQEALKNLAWRTNLDDVSNLTTILIQTERFGTSIAQALRVHADFMRTRRFQWAEELAQKMPIKLIFPVALFIFPMFFLITLGPAVATVMKHFVK